MCDLIFGLLALKVRSSSKLRTSPSQVTFVAHATFQLSDNSIRLRKNISRLHVYKCMVTSKLVLNNSHS